MEAIYAEYRLGVADYRTAVYYASAMQRSLFLRIFLFVAFFTFAYSLGGIFGLWEIIFLPIYICAAYAIVILIFLGRIERSILKFIKQDNELLGKKMSVRFEGDKVEVQTEKDKAAHAIQGVFCIIEISRLYMIYLDQQQCILMPKRHISEQQQKQLRLYLQRVLRDRFHSRFLEKKGEASPLLQKRRRW